MTSTNVTGKPTDDLWVWGTNASAPRLLHTMIEVRDLGASLRFYVGGLGMKQLGSYEFEVNRASASFVGFDSYDAGGCLELVMFWDAEDPQAGGVKSGHFSIGVPDVVAMLAKLEALGGEVTLRPVAVLEGGPQVAFLKDLDGNQIELIQTRRT